MNGPATDLSARVSTGIAGLDDILGGGFPPHSVYLIEGNPGAGKTTLALQFLLDGARRCDRGLYVTLSESKTELAEVAKSHGWTLDGIDLFELIPSEASLRPDAQYTMFHPSEVELSETTKAVLAEVERVRPTRVVFDSLSELRLLAQNQLRYRRQILALKQFFAGRGATVLLLDDRSGVESDEHLQSIAHGVVSLEQMAPEFGAERRRLRVVKLRGAVYRGGYHDFCIATGGLEVYPRLVASEHRPEFAAGRLTSGVPAVDALLGGGPEFGTSVMLMGPAGSGKSSLAVQYAVAAARRGERAALFIFDESRITLLARARELGIDLQPHIDSGLITVQQVDPAELAPGELAHAIRAAAGADAGGARVVVIDSLNGYLNAMPEERYLLIQLHELLTYLGQQGAVTFLVVAQHGLLGTAMQTPVDASYLADAVVLLRYFETAGQVRQAVSVMKKRGGVHERTIREFRLGPGGVHVGEPLAGFHGVLTGVPQLVPAKGGDA